METRELLGGNRREGQRIPEYAGVTDYQCGAKGWLVGGVRSQSGQRVNCGGSARREKLIGKREREKRLRDIKVALGELQVKDMAWRVEGRGGILSRGMS